VPLTDEEQQARRAAMRDIMTATPYIRSLGIVVEEWSPDGVRVRLPFREELSNDGVVYHGGAIASLIDTTGAAAVWAGHDFDRGVRAATVSMTVNYLGAARQSDLLGEARCLKRGRDLSFVEITVRDADGRAVADASLVYRIVP